MDRTVKAIVQALETCEAFHVGDVRLSREQVMELAGMGYHCQGGKVTFDPEEANQVLRELPKIRVESVTKAGDRIRVELKNGRAYYFCRTWSPAKVNAAVMELEGVG